MPVTLFCCVKIASTQPQLPARNCIVLHKRLLYYLAVVLGHV